MEKKVTTDDERGFVRVLTSSPREKWLGHWRPGRKYPLYSVVENNGSIFVSRTGEKKDEPYVIYRKETDTFVANDGWELREASADSRLTALGGGSAIPIPGADAGFGSITARILNDDKDPSVDVFSTGPNSQKDVRLDFHGLVSKNTDKLVNYFKKGETYSREEVEGLIHEAEMGAIPRVKIPLGVYGTNFCIGEEYGRESTILMFNNGILRMIVHVSAAFIVWKYESQTYAWYRGENGDDEYFMFPISSGQENTDWEYLVLSGNPVILIDTDNSVERGPDITSEVRQFYYKQSSGIQKSDLADGVRSSLDKADTAVQPETGKGLFSGNYNDLTNKPTLPDAQIQSDWNQSDDTKKDYIKNKPTVPEDKVFVAVYGTTTAAQVETAISAGKIPVVSYSSKLYVYAYDRGDMYFFQTTYLGQLYRVTLTKADDSWGNNYIQTEQSSNKTDTLSGNENDSNKYLSTKGVATELAKKQPTIDAHHKLDYSLLSDTPTIPTVESMTAQEITAAVQAAWNTVMT